MEIQLWVLCLNTVVQFQRIFKTFVLKPDHAQAHDNGDIHIHDLDFLNLEH